MSFDGLMEMTMKLTTFWDVTYKVVYIYQRFVEAFWLRLQGPLNVQAVHSFDTIASIYYWY
jgi:hypothetical protein